MLLRLLFLILVTGCFPLHATRHFLIDGSAEGDQIEQMEMASASADDVFTAVAVVKVIDGDTLTVNLPDTIPDVFGHELPVRIRHIDTAEMKGSGKCERDMAVKAKNVVIQLLKSTKQLDLEDVERDKFFRIDAVVRFDGVSVGQYLLDKGYATPYDGEIKKKVAWCLMPPMQKKK